MPRPHAKHLLSSVQMAHFVAHGSLRLDAVVPAEMNAEAIGVLRAASRTCPTAAPVDEAFPEGSFARPARSASRRSPGRCAASSARPHASTTTPCTSASRTRGTAQPLHGDAIIDVRTDAFDVQLMYYPQDVTLDMGGTLSVPGSHLRRTNESDTGRYQNLRGQTRLTCPAGTVVFLHHGIWHGGRRNDSDADRYMFKIRFNPTVRQLRLWDTDDLDDPAVAEELAHRPSRGTSPPPAGWRSTTGSSCGGR